MAWSCGWSKQDVGEARGRSKHDLLGPVLVLMLEPLGVEVAAFVFDQGRRCLSLLRSVGVQR